MDTSTINFYKGNHKYEVSADELATEIAQCLQIENLNFLIGAGCSSYRDDTGAEKAIPTMAGLAREFYDCNPDLKVIPPKYRVKLAYESFCGFLSA